MKNDNSLGKHISNWVIRPSAPRSRDGLPRSHINPVTRHSQRKRGGDGKKAQHKGATIICNVKN